jgi:hypothetical protein
LFFVKKTSMCWLIFLDLPCSKFSQYVTVYYMWPTFIILYIIRGDVNLIFSNLILYLAEFSQPFFSIKRFWKSQVT